MGNSCVDDYIVDDYIDVRLSEISDEVVQQLGRVSLETLFWQIGIPFRPNKCTLDAHFQKKESMLRWPTTNLLVSQGNLINCALH